MGPELAISRDRASGYRLIGCIPPRMSHFRKMAGDSCVLARVGRDTQQARGASGDVRASTILRDDKAVGLSIEVIISLNETNSDK